MAVGRAEQLRARIAELSHSRDGIVVTASFGVASIPETSLRAADLIATADAALYHAKQQGRDRVVAASLRPAPLAVGRLDLVRTGPAALDDKPRSA
jgi:diguanylate cyclase (GGDEF)-like protein